MIRIARLQDIDGVEESYAEILAHEKEYGAYTIWEEGVYPIRETAESALENGALYVMEQEGELWASMIIDHVQPGEYENIQWKYTGKQEEILVLHLLCVRPSKAGRGAGKKMVGFAIEEGRRRGCRALRLDTGAQNKPAAALYQKMGFELTGTGGMAVGGLIAHDSHLFFEKEIRVK